MSNSYYTFSDCIGMVLLLLLNLWLLENWKQSVSMSLAAAGSRCAALGMNLSGSGSWLPLSLFCFSQQMWCDCAVHHTNIIHFHTIFFVMMENWLTVFDTEEEKMINRCPVSVACVSLPSLTWVDLALN